MKITRISAITGISRTFDINVTELELTSYELGEHIATAMPFLSPAERAFITAGITADEWLDHIGIELPDESPQPPPPPPPTKTPNTPNTLLLGIDYDLGTTRATKAAPLPSPPDPTDKPFTPLPYNAADIDLTKVADCDKFQSTDGKWYTKYHCISELKEHSAWLWSDTSRWIDEETFKTKLWHWIGTKESAGNEFYGYPPTHSGCYNDRAKSDHKLDKTEPNRKYY